MLNRRLNSYTVHHYGLMNWKQHTRTTYRRYNNYEIGMKKVRHIQVLHQTARVDSIAQLTQAQQVHEQMMCEYGTKIQTAHETNANVTQVIAEQNQSLSRQQQEVRELQQRLQQEHQDYENKYKQAMDEVHNVTRQAAQELET